MSSDNFSTIALVGIVQNSVKQISGGRTGLKMLSELLNIMGQGLDSVF